MSELALTVSLLALAAALGLWIGNWKIRSVGLGIGGVLFGGIIVGHFAQSYGLQLNKDMLHFIQEFGLILFVYTIGIQVGPGFFSSLRVSGLKLNGFALMVVVLGAVVTAIIYKVANIPLPIILGIFSGAVTNTPSLGAGQQILTDLGSDPNLVGQMGMGYAMAYPMGICGILLVMWLVRIIFRISVEKEASAFNSSTFQQRDSLQTMNIAIRNANLDGLMMQDIPLLGSEAIVCSRLKRGDMLVVPQPTTEIHLGDLLHVVGLKDDLNRVRLILGEEVDVSLSTSSSILHSVRVVVTNDAVLSKRLKDLNLKQKYDVVVTRLNRTGIDLVANNNSVLQFGDILNIVGRPESIEAVTALLGNAKQKLQQVQMLPVFLGIGLGVVLGSIPVFVPGFPAALKLGLAGGPLVVALILGRIGTIGRLYWFMPPSANLALRELGIVMFLAVVGLNSGGGFIDTLIKGDGLTWIGYGLLITFVPLFITGVVARIFGKMNYLSLCGVLAGSMTDPPALAFANNIHAASGAPALSYATVYPLAMFLRIISPQLLAILFWAV
ncbi:MULTISPECIES: putative transporter [Providencia]|uniref:Transporter n=1 Tax=Providencia rettgeri TaxID=587 RepID=A0AAJ4TIJ9_PRORE|nr:MULTISPECIES: putative transporter [Providencia]MBG5894188.1 putative transporter [Providencia rettgeri]MBG5926695.1 putative transporter [Providencia rettgeri]MBJ9971245.1 putative transporter [Providencia rettgeri]MBQ0529054.1 putative transporter [Providencia rettgeri]MCF8962719.1 Aspartate/alanine antiporter [Providencia rettgeri]